MSELICDRAFCYVTEEGERRFVVEWMKPVRDKGAWRCDWIIHWFVKDATRGYSVGEDSTQSLLLAMNMVQGIITHESPSAYWLDEEGGLGLPAHSPMDH